MLDVIDASLGWYAEGAGIYAWHVAYPDVDLRPKSAAASISCHEDNRKRGKVKGG
jgi:hypothetical protein